MVFFAALLATISAAAFTDPARAAAPDAEVRQRLGELNRFSRCLATRRPAMAAGVLDLPLESGQQHGAIRDMMKVLAAKLHQYDGCSRATRNMRIKYPPALIGGLAEAVVLARPVSAEATTVRRLAAGVTSRNSAESFALCLVARSPDEALRMIKAPPASEDELQAAKQLRSGLDSCAFNGKPFAGDDFALRTYAAVGLYLAVKGEGPVSR